MPSSPRSLPDPHAVATPLALRHRRRSLLLVALPAALLALHGCATVRNLMPAKIALSDLSFDVARQANGGMPFAVELVAANDEELVTRLQTLRADQWFDPASNLKADYPKTLKSWYYELTPGLQLREQPTPFAGARGRGLFLFARYEGKGAYRLRLDSYARATVRFVEKEIVVEGTP